MIVLRRSPMKRAAPPWPRRPERQWQGADPSPRAPARAILARVPGSAETFVVPIGKLRGYQHQGYMNLVRAMACMHCFAPPRSQFCHRDEGKGMGIKTDCREGWPGCAACHHLIGTARVFPKAERRKIELLYGAQTRARIEAAGTWPARLPRWIP